MPKSQPNPKANFFFEKAGTWKESMEKLRTIMLSTGLQEEVKWGVACYTDEGKNVALIHYFKEYCAILFPKGVLMKDPHKILIQQTDNVQGARQIRFINTKEITTAASIIKDYLKEATEIERSGVKVPLKKTTEFKMPEEFRLRLQGDAKLKKAFEALTPGRQRGYLLYFSSAKQASTREARIDKYYDAILNGKGVDD